MLCWRQWVEEHDHPADATTISALNDIDPVENGKTVLIGDRPGVAGEAVMLIDVARDRDPGSRDALAEAPQTSGDLLYAGEASGSGIDELGIRKQGLLKQSPPRVRVTSVPGLVVCGQHRVEHNSILRSRMRVDSVGRCAQPSFMGDTAVLSIGLGSFTAEFDAPRIFTRVLVRLSTLNVTL